MEAKDPTYRNYDSDQAAAFAQQRRSYASALYDVIVNYHAANSNRFHSLLDVGCGSGAATRGLAGYFDQAVGIDPGRELILQARSIGGQTKIGSSIHYEICSAEGLGLSQAVKKGSVDLLSIGMAVRSVLANLIDC